MRLRLATALGLAAAVLAGPVAAAPAHAVTVRAADVVAPDLIGYDVSFPQCKAMSSLPSAQAFAIVGVNHGLGNSSNDCFAEQLTWALQSTAVSSQPRVGLYVNTQNPGLAASWWPVGDATQAGTPVRNPFGTCSHTASPACSYVYGYSMAEADVDPGVRHVAVPAAYTWWLDVEDSNDWSHDRTANRAVLEGMVAAFGAAGAPAGLYSTHQQWDRIVGRVPASSSLATAPSWLAGAVTQRGAAENCTHAPLTAGRVTLAQYTDGRLDYDIACGRFATTRIPTISGAVRVGSRLTAHAGSWSPAGIRFSYTWLRDGRSIAGATGAHYQLHAADAGTRISVRVTGTKPAFNAAGRTSDATRRVLRAVGTPSVAPAGTRSSAPAPKAPTRVTAKATMTAKATVTATTPAPAPTRPAPTVVPLPVLPTAAVLSPPAAPTVAVTTAPATATAPFRLGVR